MPSITARATPGVRYWLIAVGALLALFASQALIQALLPRAAVDFVAPLVGLAGTAGFVVAVTRGANGRAVAMEIAQDAVVVAGMRYPLANARLGGWRIPMLGTRAGTVLVLEAGGSTLRILGFGHVIAAPWTATLPTSQQYDVRVTPAELQAILDHGPPPAVVADPREAGVVRCELAVNPWGPSQGALMALPMGVAMVLAMGVGAVMESALSRVRWGQYVGAAVALSIVVGGIVVTGVRSLRRSAQLELTVSSTEITLRELASGRIRFVAPRASAQLGRFTQHVYSREGSFDYATLGIRVAGHEELFVAVHDPIHVWTSPAERIAAGKGYLTGSAEWEALLGALGIGAAARVAWR